MRGQVVTVDFGGFARGAPGFGDPVEFNHRPSLESDFLEGGENGGQVNASSAEFHPLEWILGSRGLGGDIDDVLEMEEEQPVAIPAHLLGGIAATRHGMGSIKQQLDVLRIG